jgi:hypothetical protein
VLAAFGVHIGDIRHRPHPKMEVWIPKLNEDLRSSAVTAQIIGVFDKTGNFVVDADDAQAAAIAQALSTVAKTLFAVFPASVLQSYVPSLEALAKPEGGAEREWTLGASFSTATSPPSVSGESWSTAKGHYYPLGPGVVGVWKRENVTDRGILDPIKRIPWGVPSREVGKRYAGVWTSRSMRTIRGLLHEIAAA